MSRNGPNTGVSARHDGRVTGAPERQDDSVTETLARLRSSVRVTLRARKWLGRWRAASPLPWSRAESAAMIVNAVELAALTEFVRIHRGAALDEQERFGDG